MGASCISNKCDKIIEGIYLGNKEAACDKELLQKYQIRHIIQVMPTYDLDTQHKFNFVSYKCFPVKTEYICEENINHYFNNSCNYIMNCIKKGENVLVHCKRGHHRSAIFIIAFLCDCLGWSVKDAISHIRRIRPCALRREMCMFNLLFDYLKSHKYNMPYDPDYKRYKFVK